MERIDNIIKKGKPKNKLFDGFLKKFKSIKNVEYIVAAVFIGIMLLIIFSGNLFGGEKAEETVKLTLSEYGEAVEKKMEKILSQIDGAGNVSVMITFETGKEIITAVTVSSQTNKVTSSTSSGSSSTESSTESNTPLVVGGEAVVIKELEPVVKGVVVVSQGAGSVKVKIELMKAVSTLLKLDTDNIEVFVMSK